MYSDEEFKEYQTMFEQLGVVDIEQQKAILGLFDAIGSMVFVANN